MPTPAPRPPPAEGPTRVGARSPTFPRFGTFAGIRALSALLSAAEGTLGLDSCFLAGSVAAEGGGAWFCASVITGARGVELNAAIDRACCRYCMRPKDATTTTPAATNAQRKTGHVSHPRLGDAVTTAATCSSPGNAKTTTSRHSAHRPRCSSTIARSTSDNKRSENAASTSASG